MVEGARRAWRTSTRGTSTAPDGRRWSRGRGRGCDRFRWDVHGRPALGAPLRLKSDYSKCHTNATGTPHAYPRLAPKPKKVALASRLPLGTRRRTRPISEARPTPHPVDAITVSARLSTTGWTPKLKIPSVGTERPSRSRP